MASPITVFTMWCLATILMAYTVTPSSLTKSEQETGTSQLQEMTKQRLMINRLMHRLLDAVEETYKDLGATEDEIASMKRKRGYVTACYFSSITCY